MYGRAGVQHSWPAPPLCSALAPAPSLLSLSYTPLCSLCYHMTASNPFLVTMLSRVSHSHSRSHSMGPFRSWFTSLFLHSLHVRASSQSHNGPIYYARSTMHPPTHHCRRQGSMQLCQHVFWHTQYPPTVPYHATYCYYGHIISTHPVQASVVLRPNAFSHERAGLQFLLPCPTSAR